MFGLSSADGGTGPQLLVTPALAASVQGRAVEDVLLLRDEAANLAWAIERSVEGEDGRPVDRAGAAYAAGPPAPPPPDQPTGRYVYHLRTDVPDHWLPLLPQRAQPTDPSFTFHLGVPGPTAPLGRLLQPTSAGTDVVIREEEVPREGARVTRAYQLARWMDGTTHLWLARRKRVGRGEGSSGLRFDVMDPPDTSSPPS